MTHHDTAAIRALAHRLETAAATLSSTGKNASRNIEGMNEEMRGDTAKAINDTVDRLGEELNSIRAGLSRCAEALYRYAHELDLADEKARNLINSK